MTPPTADTGGALLVVLALFLLAFFVRKEKIVTALFVSIALVILASEVFIKFEIEALTFIPLLFIGCFLVYKFAPKE